MPPSSTATHLPRIQSLRLLQMPSIGLLALGRHSPHTSRLPIAGERLGEFGALADRGPLPVKDVDGDGDAEGDAGEDRGRVLERVWFGEVAVDWGRDVSFLIFS